MSIRIGVIGMGNIGKLHCGYINGLEHTHLAAICDADESRLENLSAAEDFDHETGNLSRVFAGVARFTDYREMIKSGEVDLVIIAVPHYFHPPIAIEAFRHNVHVICEKPAAVTAREAREMNKAYQDSESVYTVMFQMRTAPASLQIKKMIEDGTLEGIRRINWIITHWFRTQHYYDSGGWRGTWQGEGGGVLTNQCPHHLDLFQWYFGLPVRLTALAYPGKWHDITVEDDVSVLMEMENGATASFITSTGDTPGDNRLEITAENGRLVYEDGGDIILERVERPVQEIIDHSEQGFYRSEPDRLIFKVDDRTGEHRLITQNTINHILHGERLIAPGTEAVRSVQLANAMLYAGLERKQIDFPVPEKDFLGLMETLRAGEGER